MKGRLCDWLRMACNGRKTGSMCVTLGRAFGGGTTAVRLLPSSLARTALSRPSIAGDLRRGETARAARAPRRTVNGAICHFSALINSQGLLPPLLLPLDRRGHRVL